MKFYQFFSMNVKRSTMGWCLLFTSLVLGTNLQRGFAQQIITQKENRDQAYHHLQKLEEGVLIVVLKTDYRKKEELQRILDNDSSSKKTKKKAKKRLEKSNQERSVLHEELISAFHQTYTFSAFRCIYDADLGDFKSGKRGLFINENLEKDPSILLEEKLPFYYAHEEYTKSSDGVRVLSYIIFDEERNRLPPPFPSVKITDLGPAMLLRSVFDKNEYKSGFAIVERLDYLLKHRMATLRQKAEKSR